MAMKRYAIYLKFDIKQQIHFSVMKKTFVGSDLLFCSFIQKDIRFGCDKDILASLLV